MESSACHQQWPAINRVVRDLITGQRRPRGALAGTGSRAEDSDEEFASRAVQRAPRVDSRKLVDIQPRDAYCGNSFIKPTVFLIDDDRRTRRVISELVRREDLVFRPFDCGAEFLDSVAPEERGCAVLEMILPSVRPSMHISIVAGARPNFMKIAPLVRAFRHAGVQPRIIHTGQHYDERLSQTFFDELCIPHPDVNLGVGSGSHVAQVAEVMRRLEAELALHPPQALVVVGDVNSTLAAALTASKLGVPVAHVEAGLRSFDRTMPEELNRILTDALSEWLFTSEVAAEANLRREGIPAERIHFVGNVMIDTLLGHLDSARALNAPGRFGCEKGGYVVLTLHRPSNVDDPDRLESILRAVHEISGRLPVLFPVHPRTRARLEEFGFGSRADLNGMSAIEPQGYLVMLGLMDSARFVMTDSGGIQEETTVLRVPCLTLRENTERPITVESGSNQLVGWRTADITAAARELLERSSGPAGNVPPLWDGGAAGRIVRVLTEGLER